MNREKIEGFMLGLGAGFFLAYVLKPPQELADFSGSSRRDAGAIGGDFEKPPRQPVTGQGKRALERFSIAG